MNSKYKEMSIPIPQQQLSPPTREAVEWAAQVLMNEAMKDVFATGSVSMEKLYVGQWLQALLSGGI